MLKDNIVECWKKSFNTNTDTLSSSWLDYKNNV